MQNFYSVVEITPLSPTENFWPPFKGEEGGGKSTLNYSMNHDLLDVPQVGSMLLFPKLLIHLFHITQRFPILGQGLTSVPLSCHQTLQYGWVVHEIVSLF